MINGDIPDITEKECVKDSKVKIQLVLCCAAISAIDELLFIKLFSIILKKY